MTQDEHVIALARIALLNPKMSPYLLNIATNIPIDLCITILSYMIAYEICEDDDPETTEESSASTQLD